MREDTEVDERGDEAANVKRVDKVEDGVAKHVQGRRA